MKLAEAEVAMEENAAYGLGAEDQLQVEQVTIETNHGAEKWTRTAAEQVTESELRNGYRPQICIYKSFNYCAELIFSSPPKLQNVPTPTHPHWI